MSSSEKTKDSKKDCLKLNEIEKSSVKDITLFGMNSTLRNTLLL